MYLSFTGGLNEEAKEQRKKGLVCALGPKSHSNQNTVQKDLDRLSKKSITKAQTKLFCCEVLFYLKTKESEFNKK